MTAANNDASPMDGAPVIDFDKFKPTRSFTSARKRKDFAMKALISCAFIVALIPLFSVLLTTIINGVKRLNLNFLRCAVYLVEYSNRGKLAQVITLLVDVMSGIPSIVAGLFAFSMFTILIGPGTINGFEGSVALSLLMLPTVVKSSEEMLKIVPHDLREASYALGVTKQRTITKIVLRTALPGIVSGAILAVARVIGETAPLLMTAGYIASTNVNLFSGQMTTLPVYVYQEYSKLNANCPANASAACVTTIPMERAWAAALVLILIVLILNLIGRLVAKIFAVKSER